MGNMFQCQELPGTVIAATPGGKLMILSDSASMCWIGIDGSTGIRIDVVKGTVGLMCPKGTVTINATEINVATKHATLVNGRTSIHADNIILRAKKHATLAAKTSRFTGKTEIVCKSP